MGRQWYPHYLGDYGRATGHLSLMEEGAYRRLLDHYYSTGKPLSASAVHLHRVCRAVAADEQSAVDFVVQQFFDEKDGLLYNARVERELLKSNDISAKRQSAAKKMHEKNSANAGANAGASAKQVQVLLNTQPQPQLKDTPIVPKGDDYTLEFLQFWKAYPNKKGKGAALKAWKRIKNRPKAKDLIAAVVQQIKSDDWKRDAGQFIPHPATWLNQRRWEDEGLSLPEDPHIEPMESTPDRILADWDGIGEHTFHQKYGIDHGDYAKSLRLDIADLSKSNFFKKYKKSAADVLEILVARSY